MTVDTYYFTNFDVINFKCYGLLRVLHSFPTRRSSDLAVRTSTTLCVTWPKRAPPSQLKILPATSWMTGEWCRSEEHTSELQSREKLVCRLLLEKKKKISV